MHTQPMGLINGCKITFCFLLLWLLLTGNVRAESNAGGDLYPDRVFGQADLTTNNAGNSASALFLPYDVAVDPQSGRIFVAEWGNSRVVSWPNAATFQSGAAADLVLGQADFTSRMPGVSATTMNRPEGVAVDGFGDLFVADSSNNRLLLFRPPFSNGMAASRVYGQPDFTSNKANYEGVTRRTLNLPRGIAVDHLGRLFVADSGNHRVLLFPAPRYNSTLADKVWGQPDFTTNSAGASATKLQGPTDVVVTPYNSIFVADTGNHRVLLFTSSYFADSFTHFDPDPSADCVVGQDNFTDHTPSSATHKFNLPTAIALDGSNYLYVSDTGNNRIYIFKRWPLIGECEPLFNDALADYFLPFFTGISDKRLDGPGGLAFDAFDNLYLVDRNNHRVLGLDVPITHVQPQLTALSPSALAAQGPDFELSVGAHFVTANSVVRVNGQERPTTFVNSRYLLAKIPAADIAQSGLLTIDIASRVLTQTLLSNAQTIQVYARTALDWMADVHLGGGGGLYYSYFDQSTIGANTLVKPNGVRFDPTTGHLLVADTRNNRLLGWSGLAATANDQAADLVIGQPDFWTPGPYFGRPLILPDNLGEPADLAFDGNGNLYVADVANQRVLLFQAPLQSGMSATLVFGQQGDFFSNAANAGGVSANSLWTPLGVATDKAGNLYVADAYNHRVLVYRTPLTTDTTADLVFGQPTFTSNSANQGQPTPSAQSLSLPTKVAVAEDGTLYIADTENHRVLLFRDPLTSDQIADDHFGQLDFTSATPNGDGLSASTLNLPSALALDKRGYLYVADRGNNRLLVYGQEDRSADAIVNGVTVNGIAVADNLQVAVASDTAQVMIYDQPVANLPARLTALLPSTVSATGGAFALTISGHNFLPDSQVFWNGSELAASFVHPGLLRVTVPAANIAAVGSAQIKVTNPAPGGGASNELTLTIDKANQLITFGSLTDHTADEAPFHLNATASSGLPVSYSASGTCAVNGNVVTLVGVGACTIQAMQAGDATFEPASVVTQHFTIFPVGTVILRKLYLPLVQR